MNDLTLIIPAKYEHQSLPIFLEELKLYNCYKYIIIQRDDLKTKNVIKENDLTKIIFQDHNGYGAAIIKGINSSQTKYSCIINADGSMSPKYLKNMLDKCKENDLVFGSRYLKQGGSEDDTVLTYIGNKFFTLFGNIFFRLNLSDILFTYILGKTNSLKKLNLSYNDFRLCVELPIKAKRNNFKYISVPCFEKKRIAGKKKVSEFKDGTLILYAMLKYIFDIKS